MGIALLGSLLTVVYQALLVIPAGVPDAVTELVDESISQVDKAAAALPADLAAALTTSAQHAFTIGLAVSAIAAALLLAVATVVAARTIPAGSRRTGSDVATE